MTIFVTMTEARLIPMDTIDEKFVFDHSSSAIQ